MEDSKKCDEFNNSCDSPNHKELYRQEVNVVSTDEYVDIYFTICDNCGEIVSVDLA